MGLSSPKKVNKTFLSTFYALNQTPLGEAECFGNP